MEEEKRQLAYGDVIGVDRGYYQHFGIYIGDQQVIHYNPIDGDLKNEIAIHIAKFESFLGDEVEYFICDFSPFYQPPEKVNEVVSQGKVLKKLIDPKLNLTEEFDKANGVYVAFQTARYKVYSPEETVQRAYSRLGEVSYDLIRNNCEHFAIWCKTGISESHQVNHLLKLLKTMWIVT